MYDRILVPTDGSEAAADAVAHARSHADSYNARLVVLAVVEAADTGTTVAVDDRHAARADDVNNTVESLAETGIDAEGVVETGVPSRVILDHAPDADLIVMSTHARSGVGRFLFGSVTEQVIRDGTTPVLAVQR